MIPRGIAIGDIRSQSYLIGIESSAGGRKVRKYEALNRTLLELKVVRAYDESMEASLSIVPYWN